jgi:HEAT repeat protein
MYVWSPLPRNASATLRDAAHAKVRVRLSAIPDLVRWSQTEERETCVARLTQLVDEDEDLEVRAAAALALADAQATSSLATLLRAAASGLPRLRQMALVAIGELAEPGDDDALGAVRIALASEAPALRFQGLVAAGRLMPHAELSSWLGESLGDSEARLRYIACRIIEERFFSDATVDETVRRDLEQKLASRLTDADPDVVVAAAVSLAPRGSLAARDVLVTALNRRRGFAQADDEQAAIELCADLGLDAARPGLRARAFGAAWAGSSRLAFQARVALARLGDERAREHILRGLSSSRRSVRAQCVAAAGLARLEAARSRLLEMRRDERVADLSSVDEALLALDRSRPSVGVPFG